MYSKIVLILFIFDIMSCSVTFTRRKFLTDKLTIKRAQLDKDSLIICKLQPNSYDCSAETSSSKFYFDTGLKTCSTFEYSECDTSQNQFNTLHECNTICFKSLNLDISAIKNLTHDLICRLQPDFGKCNMYYPMYYFDVSTHTCKGFSYSGCGGNGNKFTSKYTCKETCTNWLPVPSRVHPDHIRVH